MKQIKFIILFSIFLLTSNQKLLSQDLKGFRFICLETSSSNKDTSIFDFRADVFHLKKTRYIKSHDTTLSSTTTFQYSIDTSKYTNSICIYDFKRSYTSDFVWRTYTVYGQLAYHMRHKTLTLTYYGGRRGEKEARRTNRYSIVRIETSEKKTE